MSPHTAFTSPVCIPKRTRHPRAQSLIRRSLHTPCRTSIRANVNPAAPIAKPATITPSIPLPSTAFTLRLQLRLQEKSHAAATSLLCEYAREAMGENDVLRCDVMYEINRLNRRKTDVYHVWILFANSNGYKLHQTSSHFAKLHQHLDVTSISRSIAQPLYPTAKDWSSEWQEEQRLSEATLSLIQAGHVDEIDDDDVIVLTASAKAGTDDMMPALIGVCEQYVEEVQREGAVRAGVFAEDKGVVVISVHADEAFFDSDLGSDFVDRWRVKRFRCVWPPRGGWEKRESEVDEVRAFMGPEVPFGDGALAVKEAGELSADDDQQYRLLQGPSAFDAAKKVIWEMARKNDVRVMIMTGWNASRAGALLDQLHPAEGDVGKIFFRFGVGVTSCLCSLQKIREGVEKVQEYDADVIIGFGGGAVMDFVKVVAKLARGRRDQVEGVLKKIEEGVSGGLSRVCVQTDWETMPVLLIPGNVGSGAEFIDMCVLASKTEDAKWRRISVDVMAPKTRSPERTVMVDSRLISPRRLDGFHAAQGALLIVCRGIETIIALHEHGDNETMQLAEQAITEASETILLALREPVRSTGASRDPLTNAKTRIGIAADCVGRLGICSRIALAVVDALIDGATPFCFRMVLIRITAALVTELCAWEEDAAKEVLQRIKRAFLVEEEAHIAVRLLRRAEDADVSLLPPLGMARRTVPNIANEVATSLQQEGGSFLEGRFKDVEALRRVLHSALDHQYEL